MFEKSDVWVVIVRDYSSYGSDCHVSGDERTYETICSSRKVAEKRLEERVKDFIERNTEKKHEMVSMLIDRNDRKVLIGYDAKLDYITYYDVLIVKRPIINYIW
jgi:hypothetical protein